MQTNNVSSRSTSEPAARLRTLPHGEDRSLPIPFGWYALACSADLAPGDVQPLYYFDEHLVLFRTEDGKAHVTAAFCPHLGAHLGYGGRVEGNAIICPFHGWRFDGDGVCVSVPYARAIPRRAANGPCLYSYPVQERNRMIWAWHHPRRLPPLFDIDDVSELSDPDWSEFTHYEWEVNAPIQEAGENAVDIAHFVAVHGAREMPEARITLAGHRRDTEVTAMVPAIDARGNIDLTRMERVHLVTRNCGPGMSTQTFELGAMTVMLATVTPVTPARMKLCFNFTKRLDTPAHFDPLVDGLIAEIVRQVEQDIPIWENKVFRDAPILCDGDGPIAKYRRWFGQFYDAADLSGTDASTRRMSRVQALFSQVRSLFGEHGLRWPPRWSSTHALARSAMDKALASTRTWCWETIAAIGCVLKLPQSRLLRPHPVENQCRSSVEPPQ